MKITKITIFSILLAMIAASCATPTDESGNPVKHADRVKVFMYDSKPRGRSTSVDVLDLSRGGTEPGRPYKVIAVLTCEGADYEEPEMLSAIKYRARQLGAEAVIIRPPDNSYGLWTALSKRMVFRGQAIVYADAAN